MGIQKAKGRAPYEPGGAFKIFGFKKRYDTRRKGDNDPSGKKRLGRGKTPPAHQGKRDEQIRLRG